MSYLTEGCCPWQTTGATIPITGCRFTLAPMCDDYINIILDAVKQTNCEKIWSHTDKTSTVYRGKTIHVVDAVKSCFIHSYRDDVHMNAEFTFSKGCPGDSDGDSFLSADDVLVNNIQDKNFPVTSKISFYPLGTTEYMQGIIDVVNMAKDMGIYETSAHYCTILQGDVQTIFTYLNQVLHYAEENIVHFVFQVTLNVNSPTPSKGEK